MQQHNSLATPCSTIVTGLATSSTSQSGLVPAAATGAGCLMPTSQLPPSLGSNNQHMNQSLQQQQQHMSQEQQHQDPAFPAAQTPPILHRNQDSLMMQRSTGAGTLMSGFDPCTVSHTGLITPVSQSGLASLFGNPSKPRTESFAYDEVRILLQEIELRKHVLLSISHSMNRFKRRAWEEVAVNMANRCPYAPRRTADQVKKKWENLVSKTKQKLRSGRVTAETDWSDTNTAVLEFLAHHNPFLRMRYATAAASILSSGGGSSGNRKRNSGTTTITTDFAGLTQLYDSTRAQSTRGNLSCAISGPSGTMDTQAPVVIKEEVRSISSAEANAEDESTDRQQQQQQHQHMSVGAHSTDLHQECNGTDDRPNIPSFVRMNGSMMSAAGDPTGGHSNLMTGLPFGPTVTSQLIGLTDAAGSPRLTCHLGPDQTRLLVDQLSKEHGMRMEILQLQKRAWQLQIELLQNSVHPSDKQSDTQ